jgi:SAM-dependent methyltransferase
MLVAFASTLFLSATLLFLVQPMVGKLALPLLGGTPAVWNTCMVFFQALLLAGYSYGHFLTRGANVRKQMAIHAFVLAAALVPLALLRFDVVRLAEHWPPPATANPAGWLLAVLLLAAGLPFFAVSTTAPLLQKWFAGTDHPSARDPYFLYGASNLGSMLALLAYPTFVERHVGVQVQALAWAAGFVALALSILLCGRLAGTSAPPAVKDLGQGPADEPGPFRQLRWVLLAFVPSSLMLGLTTHITTDIAAIPLLWILPLALYLLSFIFVFSGTFFQNLLHWLALTAVAAYLAWETWAGIGDSSPDAAALAKLAGCAAAPVLGLLLFFNRSQGLLHGTWVLLLPVLICAVAVDFDLRHTDTLAEYQVILLHLAALFTASMVCHGELARTRPAPAHLTGFYLLLSLGGVLGGLFNALVAPVVFDHIVEYPLVIALACLLLPRAGVAQPGWPRRLDAALAGAIGLCGLASAGFFLINGFATTRQVSDFVRRTSLLDRVPSWAKSSVQAVVDHLGSDDSSLMLRRRNFFGCFRVYRMEDEGGMRERHLMQHGTTTHGMQCYYPEERRSEPLTYFHRQGPIGQLFEAVYARERPQRVCVLGVGTGTLAAYLKPGWELKLYEIDHAVVEVAFDPHYFTYLPDALARGVKVDVEMGDGRLQIGKAADQSFDLIFMDAFTSDAVPVHLLTREALQTYLRKLAPGGLIVVNIANRYLRLEPVLGNLARELKIEGRGCAGDEDQSIEMYGTHWVVLGRDEASLGKLAEGPAEDSSLHWQPLRTDARVGVWTDDYSNLLGVFRWNR